MPNKHVRARQRQSVVDANAHDDWLGRELGDCAFNDERLGKRFRSLLEQLSSSPGGSIPLACQDWANTKAPIDSSTMIGSVKPRSWPDISKPHGIGSQLA